MVNEAEDIEGLTAKQIQDKFALPNTSKYICDAKIYAGTHMRVGVIKTNGKIGTIFPDADIQP